MSQIKERFQKAATTPCDINEHLEVLYHLAKQCSHITEFGTRHCVSTTAFLAAQPAILHCYDLVKQKEVDELLSMAGETKMHFHVQDTGDQNLEIEETDMLFVDTLHTYDHVKKELARHPDKVKKFVVFHDTELFGYRDETVHGKLINPNPIAKRGINAAIVEEMMENRKDWKLKVHYAHNNGLTVFERV